MSEKTTSDIPLESGTDGTQQESDTATEVPLVPQENPDVPREHLLSETISGLKEVDPRIFGGRAGAEFLAAAQKSFSADFMETRIQLRDVQLENKNLIQKLGESQTTIEVLKERQSIASWVRRASNFGIAAGLALISIGLTLPTESELQAWALYAVGAATVAGSLFYTPRPPKH